MEVQGLGAAAGALSLRAALRSQFAIETAEDEVAFVIRVRGELDRSDVPRLERAFAEAETSRATRLLLDLEQLTFIDAAGLHALSAAHGRSADNGDRLRMTRGGEDVAAIFRLTAFDMTLPFATAGLGSKGESLGLDNP